VNNEIFEDLKVRISDLRRLWFDKANEHLRESEDSVADLLNRFASGRVTIANTFVELPIDIKAENETDDN
jgi:ribosomal protein L20